MVGPIWPRLDLLLVTSLPDYAWLSWLSERLVRLERVTSNDIKCFKQHSLDTSILIYWLGILWQTDRQKLPFFCRSMCHNLPVVALPEAIYSPKHWPITNSGWWLVGGYLMSLLAGLIASSWLSQSAINCLADSWFVDISCWINQLLGLIACSWPSWLHLSRISCFSSANAAHSCISRP